MGRGQVEKRTYLSIQQGKVIERLATSKERAADLNDDKIKAKFPSCNRIREYIKDEVFQKTFIERVDDYIEGVITGIITKDGDYGEEIRITMNDGTEQFLVQFQAKSSSARSFMNILPNIEPSSIVKIRPWKDHKSGGEGLTISQGGNKLDYFWTKDNPGQHPKPPDFGGMDYKDWGRTEKSKYEQYKIDRLNFLLDNLEELSKKFGQDNAPNLPETDIGGHGEPITAKDVTDNIGDAKNKALAGSTADGMEDDLPF